MVTFFSIWTRNMPFGIPPSSHFRCFYCIESNFFLQLVFSFHCAIYNLWFLMIWIICFMMSLLKKVNCAFLPSFISLWVNPSEVLNLCICIFIVLFWIPTLYFFSTLVYMLSNPSLAYFDCLVMTFIIPSPLLLIRIVLNLQTILSYCTFVLTPQFD